MTGFGERSAARNFSRAPTINARQVNSSYHHRVALLAELGGSTSSQLQSMSVGVVIPVGSTEQHGPHLPLDTDTRIATAVADGVTTALSGGSGDRPAALGGRAGRRLRRQRRAPKLPRNHLDRNRRAEHAAAGVRQVGYLLGAAAGLRQRPWRQCQRRCAGRSADCGPKDETPGGAPARWQVATPTPATLKLQYCCTFRRPRCCTDRWRAGNGAPLSDLLPSMRRGGVAAVSELGVLGDPTTATAAEGERMLAEMVDDCLSRIGRWAPAATGSSHDPRRRRRCRRSRH